MSIYSSIVPAAAALALAASPAGAQTLRLADAFRRADAGAYANRAAAATARADAARAGEALRGILPTARLEAGWLRTDDPIGAFGITLRQRAVTPAAFAPASLNDPAPASDATAGAVLELPLVNADAWLGRRAALRAGDASAAAARWTATRTRVDVVKAYYGALLAAERTGALEAASRAAHDHVRAAEASVASGAAVRSDALLAAVKAGEIDADLAGARADAALARAELALLLGSPDDTAFALPASLPDAETIRAAAAADAGSAMPRADVEAASLGADAAASDHARAAAAWLPRLNAFARTDWHDAGRPFGGAPMWTLGIMGSWTPFDGGADRAALRVAAGRLEAARAGAEATAAGARLDAARRRSDLAVALQRLAISEQALVQSAEAHRLVTRKYEGGLASVVELLDAAAADTQSHLRHAAARYDAIVARAEQLQSLGLPLDALTTLDR
jgi:outer membrane protein